MAFFWLRLLHAIVYLAGVPYVRTLVFTLGSVATFGLFATIFGVSRFKPEATGVAVGLYITAAYWFTASTSFANPAVAIARSLTNTFSGINPANLPGFIIAQVIGALVAWVCISWLIDRRFHRNSSTK